MEDDTYFCLLEMFGNHEMGIANHIYEFLSPDTVYLLNEQVEGATVTVMQYKIHRLFFMDYLKDCTRGRSVQDRLEGMKLATRRDTHLEFYEWPTGTDDDFWHPRYRGERHDIGYNAYRITVRGNRDTFASARLHVEEICRSLKIHHSVRELYYFST